MALATIATIGPSPRLWAEVGPTIQFFQHLGLMEVVHAAMGLTPSSAFMTFIQIMSRVLLVAILNECKAEVGESVGWVPMMLVAWSIADSTRYLYYCISVSQQIAASVKSVMVAMKMMK